LTAYVVVDLGFGDCGKGLITDFLVRRSGAKLVVRYNGGAQAGHNVVTPEGRHHTFAQFGAASFVPQVRTFLSRHVVVHPTALLVEARVLGEKGLSAPLERVRISEQARITTPFHQAGGRIRELARGAARHGTCGVGVGETVKDAWEFPDESIVAGDLRSAATLRRKLKQIRERKHGELKYLGAEVVDRDSLVRELTVFESDTIIDDWIEQAASLSRRGLIVSDLTLRAWLAENQTAVFEGAQGALLDEWCGFHPFTSWSTCTAANATELLAESAPDACVERIGVLRAHIVRHGPGPLPTKTVAFRDAVFDHNCHNTWQGPLRYGWFDAVLARYALDIVGGVDTLAITHLDAVPRMPTWKACGAYRVDRLPNDADLIAEHAGDGVVSRLRTPATQCLARQSRLTGVLEHTSAVYSACEPSENAVTAFLEMLLARRIDMISRGPRACDVLDRGQTTRRTL
jgi:adenylosuccinate synthase